MAITNQGPAYPFLPNALQSYIADMADIDESLDPSERYLPGAKLPPERPEEIDLDMNVAIRLNDERTAVDGQVGNNVWLTLQNIKTKEIQDAEKHFLADSEGRDHTAIVYYFTINPGDWKVGSADGIITDEVMWYCQLEGVAGITPDAVIDIELEPYDQQNPDPVATKLMVLEAAQCYIQGVSWYVGLGQGVDVFLQCYRKRPDLPLRFKVLLRSDTAVLAEQTNPQMPGGESGTVSGEKNFYEDGENDAASG